MTNRRNEEQNTKIFFSNNNALKTHKKYYRHRFIMSFTDTIRIILCLLLPIKATKKNADKKFMTVTIYNNFWSPQQFEAHVCANH